VLDHAGGHLDLEARMSIVLVMLISGDKKIMGDYINGKLARILGWGTTALMTAAAVILVLS
jgi:Mn2+/Fe2+ NRAMP family transporter